MHRKRRPLIDFGMAIAVCGLGMAAEPEADPSELPRLPPIEAEQALATFTVKPGFKIELVAAEPLVADPIAMAFDERGRLYVVEMRDYPERRDEKLGRIRLLEDLDRDGVFDRSSIYAEALPWPTAVAVWDGGIFVGASPDILYFKDQDGDGRADVRRTVMTGFAEGNERLNVQGLPNSFQWGIDNRMHGTPATNGGRLSVLGTDGPELNVNGRDFSFDPRAAGLDLRAESGGGQYGVTFDTWGRKFVCSNSHHIQAVLYADRYREGRRETYRMPAPLVDIAADGPAAEVFRLSPDEPWRIVRTRWRVAGAVSGPVEGGGRVSGYFTASTGICVYRGHLFSPEFQNDAFIADAGSNLIHRKKVVYTDGGVEPSARRPSDELEREFVASTDNWFRPTQLVNGPDGALYVSDMYREVIEHPWSIPETIKRYLDLNSGSDRGRIYRIVPDGVRAEATTDLSVSSASALVVFLDHPNGWHRETASRLLHERQDTSAKDDLEELLQSARRWEGKVHALYALQSLGALTKAHLQQAIADEHAAVRMHAVALSELPDLHLNDERYLRAANDESAAVRYQLALSLGRMGLARRESILLEVVRGGRADPWISAAVLNHLEGEVDLWYEELIRGDLSPGQMVFLSELAAMCPEGSLARWTSKALEIPGRAHRFSVLTGIAKRCLALGRSLERYAGESAMEGLIDDALAVAGNEAENPPARVQALTLLSALDLPGRMETFKAILDSAVEPTVQLAALDALGTSQESDSAELLIECWRSVTPGLQSRAMHWLIQRNDRLVPLLKAVAKGFIPTSALNTSQIAFLRDHRDEKVRSLARSVLSGSGSGERIRDALERLSSALRLEGDDRRGRTSFQQRCASCHRAGDEGSAFGPDVATFARAGKEAILTNFIDPNREVSPRYMAYLVETKAGDNWLGYIVQEDADSVTLRMPLDSDRTLFRRDIERLTHQGISAMPEGLETGMNLQEVADLLAFLTR